MPRAHGRMDGNFDHIDRRRRTLLRRYLDRHNCLFVSKESHASAFILRDTEQRCIATFVSLELDTYWKMLQGSELRNYLQSGISGVDNHKSILAPLMIFQVNMPEEQRINLPESTSLEDSSCRSSGTQVMPQSRNRNKKSKSFNDSSITSLPRCSEMDSSDSFCDSLATVGSDALVSDTPIVEKAQKRSSRKKGKRKGKQYKREKVSTGLESQCEETTCAASVVGNSLHSVPVTLGEQISGNLSENSRFPNLSTEDTIIEKDDSETNDAYLDSSATMMSCVSYNDELDDSESLASSISQVLGCDNTTDLHHKSSATCHPERTPSFVNMVSANTHRKGIGNGNQNPFKSSFSTTLDHYDVDPALESFQDCRNDGISENCSNDVEPSLAIKDRCEISISRVVDSVSTNSDPLFCSTIGLYVRDNGIANDCHACDPYWPEDVLRQGTTERAECSSEACSTSDFHPVISGKRIRTGKKMTSRTGKNNTHSVWKKVQKMDTEHCINGKKDVYSMSRQVDFPSKYCDTRSRPNTSDCLKQNQKGKNGRYPCSYEMINQTSKSYSSKIASTAVDSSETNSNRKPSSALKTVNHYSRKGSPNGKAAPSRPSRSHAQKKDKLRNSPKVNEGILNSNSVLISLCSSDSQLLGIKPPEKVDFSQSEQQKGGNYSEEGSLSENTCSMSSEMTSAVTDSQMGLSGSAFDSLGHAPMEMQSSNNEHTNLCRDLFLMDTDSKCKNIQAECSHPEFSEPDKFGPVSQKWVPVGRKETVESCASLMDNMKSSLIDGLGPTKVDTKSVVEEENTRVHSFVPLKRGALQCSNFSTAELNSSSSEMDKSTGNLRSDPYTDGVFAGVIESNLHSSNGSDLNKLFHAINNSYNSHAMAEDVHQASGTPLAEFERLICSTSPSICQISHSISCRSCFPEQLRNDSCYWHQFHDVTLGSLWQWYEEPGCYGLEVKAEEKCTSKRLHNGCLEFKAYFVPYLSAVQLFGRPGFNNACCGADKATKSSEYDPRPIFAKLLSQPCNEEDACLLGSVSSVKDKLHNQSVRIGGDEELVFEYFEHAQPPQRKPLFEKIKELVSGDGPSNNQIYGDPLKLERMNLHDLHPASWFSVAWYPIYRIPEGNFRAAFLTYHSLGHFVHQNASLNTAGGSTHIVSPVVGLQSYNAKKECWFQPRVSNSKEVVDTEVLSSNTYELLEERLRTLEHTASLMATAKVRKDNHRYSNNHPDYNHFFSRW